MSECVSGLGLGLRSPGFRGTSGPFSSEPWQHSSWTASPEHRFAASDHLK